VNVLDPDVVVVGGGAMDAGELLLEPARLRYAEASRPSRRGRTFRSSRPSSGRRPGRSAAAKLALEELDA
jgi:predicted NBD/HSP70 family sugar kinase